MPTAADAGPIKPSNWLDLFKYPRSLIVSWLGNAGAQTGVYGITLWAPSLFVLLLKVSPQQAAKMMILLSVFGFVGRVSFSFFSEWFGRRNAGGLLGFGGGLLTILAGYNYDAMVMGVSAFWLLLAVGLFLCRWRLCHRRALRRRGLAVTSADLRHGLGLWLWRDRQDHRPARPGPDRG